VTFAVAEVSRSPEGFLLAPGTVDEALNVVCGVDALTILKIKPAGSSLMDFKDFVNGRHVQPGDRFVTVDQ
jgi:methionyl-tRNA formyltransferase